MFEATTAKPHNVFIYYFNLTNAILHFGRCFACVTKRKNIMFSDRMDIVVAGRERDTVRKRDIY